ncbi:hypothetical protein A3H16_03610, partial [Candidatus Kaiserbacteria bacterium RIFCSPLOWO2_12_FULL_53_8]
MNTKTIVISVVVILIIIIGGYFVYTSMSPAAPAAANPQDQTASTGTTTPQVQGQDVKVGTGKVAEPGMRVSVLYVGKFTDGTVFDSSAAHGNVPLEFVLGASEGPIVPIPGFQIGVNGMKEGGERLLAIPPTLGYGAQDVKDATGKVIIPGNS